MNSLCILGYNLPNLLRVIREPIIESVKLGAIVRIMIVNPNSSAFEVMKKHTNFPDMLISNTKAGLTYAQNILNELGKNESVNGKFDVRLMNWIPSCSMVLLNVNDDSGICKISINSAALRQPAINRSNLIIEKSKYPKEFDHFLQSFDLLWQKDSSHWNGEILNIE